MGGLLCSPSPCSTHDLDWGKWELASPQADVRDVSDERSGGHIRHVWSWDERYIGTPHSVGKHQPSVTDPCTPTNSRQS